MKYLLTSAGIKNTRIHNALLDLLGKPIAESNALCIPTAIYPFRGGPSMAYRFISGSTANPMCELGWKSLGVLELTALPSIKEEYWIAAVQETDALLVYGGDVLYLCRWMRESGLTDLLPSLRETVYVGVSAGSMVTAPIFGETYDDPSTPFVIDKGLGLVDFALLPHLDHEDHPESSTANVERMAAEVSVPMYAIDDETAIKVTDGTAEVVSEGHWKLFSPNVEKLSGFARDLWPLGLKGDGSEEVITVQIQPEPLPCGEITDIKTPDVSKPSGTATPRDVDNESATRGRSC